MPPASASGLQRCTAIKLRSGKDVDEVLSLMASPLSQIAICRCGDMDNRMLLVALQLAPKLSLDTEYSIFLRCFAVTFAATIRRGRR